MDSIASAASAYGAYSLQNQLAYGNRAETSSASNAKTAGSPDNLATQSQGSSVSGQLNSLVALTRYAMDAMGLGSDSKVTFSQLKKYQSQLQEEFNSAVKKGLEEQGIKEVPDFTIQLNGDGTATINTASQYKEALQKIFDGNPELLKTYQQIEALSGIDKAREAMQISPTEMRKRIQIEAMTSWWAQTGNSSGSQFSSYNNGSLSLLQGINLSV